MHRATKMNALPALTVDLLLTNSLLIDKVFASLWQQIGIIPQSRLELTEKLAKHISRFRFSEYVDEARKKAGAMLSGCDCTNVVLGKMKVTVCRLYGQSCMPRNFVAPGMVSDEGGYQ